MDKNFTQSLINKWLSNRKKMKSHFGQFLAKLKKYNNRQVDEWVHQTHNASFQQFDCLQCANCCKTISPIFELKDIERIANYLKIKERDFIQKYLRIDEDGDYVLQQTPCPFLQPDLRCQIYEVRPGACAHYPHTHKPNFSAKSALHTENTYSCPVVFHIIATLEKNITSVLN